VPKSILRRPSGAAARERKGEGEGRSCGIVSLYFLIRERRRAEGGRERRKEESPYHLRLHPYSPGKRRRGRRARTNSALRSISSESRRKRNRDLRKKGKEEKGKKGGRRLGPWPPWPLKKKGKRGRDFPPSNPSGKKERE